jgi:protein-S-isoprenylcysteine O-methyltransferase Ste14
MVALKTLIFTVIVPSTEAILIPYLLLSSGFEIFSRGLGIVRFLGLLPIVIGALIYFWCAWDFTFSGSGTPAPIDPPKELVVRGLYRFVRNPMYIGVSLPVFGEALLFESATLLVYAAAVLLVFHLFVVGYEEPHLRRKFGDSYKGYCDTVPRWLPDIRSLMKGQRGQAVL